MLSQMDEMEQQHGKALYRMQRSLGTYQASAIKKITVFAAQHRGIMEQLFPTSDV